MREQEQLQQLGRLVEEAPLPLWISDSNGQIISTNSALQRLIPCGDDHSLTDLLQPKAAVDTLLQALRNRPDEIASSEASLAGTPDARHTVTAAATEIGGETVLMGWLTPLSEQPTGSEWLVNQIAHALRNPIFAASVQAEAISLRASQIPEITKPVSILYRQLKRLETSVDEMLLLGRPVKVSTHEIDVAKLLSTIAEDYRNGRRRDAAEVKVELDQDNLTAEWDARVAQVMLERLLDNAVEHTAEPHSIRISAKADNGEITLAVCDEGEGIPEELKDRVFLPFFPQHRGRPGLGLTIAKKYAEALGGRIELSSEQGKGTEVRCILPG
jgi:nitrogen-specific signal transduction histidine kinase